MSEIKAKAAERRLEIQALVRKGLTQTAIAKQLGITRQRVWQIMNNYKHWEMFYK